MDSCLLTTYFLKAVSLRFGGDRSGDMQAAPPRPARRSDVCRHRDERVRTGEVLLKAQSSEGE